MSAFIVRAESDFKLGVGVGSGLEVVVVTDGNSAPAVDEVSLVSVSSMVEIPGFAGEVPSEEGEEPGGCGGFSDRALLLLSSSTDGKRTLEAAAAEPDITGAGCNEGGKGTFFRPQAGSEGVGILASNAEELSLQKKKKKKKKKNLIQISSISK